jgi:tRNA pseudouridine55 synthase
MHVGLLNINKPPGMNSRRVVDVVSRLAGTKRVGHAGTLDPMATGVLVVCLGWATRLVTFVQERPKKYAATFLLGRRSNTDDVTGEVVATLGAAAPSWALIEELLQTFVGTIRQVPPQFSAVHVDGVRAHKIARRGMTASIEPRPVEIHRIALVGYSYPELVVDIECGSGTYVRSIGRDLGNALGCGAVMSALVRESIGEFTLASAVSLESLEKGAISDFLLPPLSAVKHLPRFSCSPADCNEFARGRPLVEASAADWADLPVAIVDSEENLVALAEYDAGRQVLQPRQVFVSSVEGQQ